MATQQALSFNPQPLPPVVDQRVPRSERQRLCRMSRAILERLRLGAALASELQAMFPKSRSVRTRISNVSAFLRSRDEGQVCSKPVKGSVGDWLYWLEQVK